MVEEKYKENKIENDISKYFFVHIVVNLEQTKKNAVGKSCDA